MCRFKQCCAPILTGRCPNETVCARSDHCALHRDHAVKLYINYKRICKIAYDLDIDLEIPDTRKYIRYLTGCHEWFAKAYGARLEHRNYAYVPECYDDGHNLQFKIIQDKIDQCRNKLRRIQQMDGDLGNNEGTNPEHNYEGNSQDNSEDNHNNEGTDDIIHQPTEDISKAIYHVNKFKRKQLKDHQEFEKMVQENIKENQKIFRERQNLIDICTKIISAEIKRNQDYNMFFLEASALNTITTLININYFDNYRPKRCDKCSCGEYIPELFRLGCPCLAKEDNNIKEYLIGSSLTRVELKLICETLLRHIKMIRPIISDLVLHYQVYDTQLLNITISLVWDDNLDRLVLGIDSIPNLEKRSKSMASSRLRHNKLRGYICETVDGAHDLSSKDIWFNMLDCVQQYIDLNNKLPSGKSKNSKVQAMNDWIMVQKKNYGSTEGCMKYSEVVNSWGRFTNKYDKYFND